MEAPNEWMELYPQLLASDRALLRSFLGRNGLSDEGDIEYACCLADSGGAIQACGCSAGNVLKCFAVSPALRGQNVLGALVSRLTAERFAKGIYRLFVFTKPENAALFEGCGFTLIAKTASAAMLENGAGGVKRYLAGIEPGPAAAEAGAVVMNADPFTLGHRYLAEYAARRCKRLYLFVLEEERSAFPFADRLSLVRQGTQDLDNVRVCAGGPYLISAATFPAYFLKKDTDAVRVQAELDATVFAEKIAPPLGITQRFVGEEPFSASTARYNEQLERVLPPAGIRVDVVPRRTNGAGRAISATELRQRLGETAPGEWMREFVPESTYAYLMQRAKL